MSKGVISTDRNLISIFYIVLKCLGFSPENSTWNQTDSFLGMVPIFHIYGLAYFSCVFLGSGSTIFVSSKFYLVDIFRFIENYRITYFPLVPPILWATNKVNIAKKYDLSSLHTVICSVAPVSKEYIDESTSGFLEVRIRQENVFSSFLPCWSTCYRNTKTRTLIFLYFTKFKFFIDMDTD